MPRVKEGEGSSKAQPHAGMQTHTAAPGHWSALASAFPSPRTVAAQDAAGVPAPPWPPAAGQPCHSHRLDSLTAPLLRHEGCSDSSLPTARPCPPPQGAQPARPSPHPHNPPASRLRHTWPTYPIEIPSTPSPPNNQPSPPILPSSHQKNLPSSLPGPVHDVAWSPTADVFCCVHGFMPAASVLYDAKLTQLCRLGTEAPRNTVRRPNAGLPARREAACARGPAHGASPPPAPPLRPGAGALVPARPPARARRLRQRGRRPRLLGRRAEAAPWKC